MVLFRLERLVPLPAEQAWRRLTDWPRHATAVPLTRVTVLTPPPTAVGTVFVARSGVGPLAFDDTMEVTVWRPPAFCRLEKRGGVVTGWAEIEVHPCGERRSRAVWREDLSVRPLPPLFDQPLGWTARRMFGRVVDGLLGPDPDPGVGNGPQSPGP
ncbi:SRPBCC family protein [Streptomyces sp. NPDC047079]|uniref:SRPBCC family protein n=1 Tax=Streptomyces sp. NPDC047079 TaxID=3154607 RepID=UPI0033E3B27B